MNKILPLFAGMALLTVSIANASELMQLTTAQMDKVTAGAISYPSTVTFTLNDIKNITTTVNLQGNLAAAAATADAYGNNTNAQTLTQTSTQSPGGYYYCCYAEPGHSSAASASVSASQGGY